MTEKLCVDILDCHGQNKFIHMTRYTNCSAALLAILAATVALFAASRGAERPGRPKKPGEPQGTFGIVGKSVIELCDNIYLLSNRGECKVEGEDCRQAPCELSSRNYSESITKVWRFSN